MFDRLRIAVALVSFSALGACTAPADGGSPTGGATDSNELTHESIPSTAEDTVNDTVDVAHAAERPAAPAATSLWLDGAACTTTETSLDTGLDGKGWTLTLKASCPTALTLKISGVTDERYPQTTLVPFLREEGAVLVLARSVGQSSDTFLVSNPGGEITIVSGPTAHRREPVKGKAIVVDRDVAHDLRFDVQF